MNSFLSLTFMKIGETVKEREKQFNTQIDKLNFQINQLNLKYGLLNLQSILFTKVLHGEL